MSSNTLIPGGIFAFWVPPRFHWRAHLFLSCCLLLYGWYRSSHHKVFLIISIINISVLVIIVILSSHLRTLIWLIPQGVCHHRHQDYHHLHHLNFNSYMADTVHPTTRFLIITIIIISVLIIIVILSSHLFLNWTDMIMNNDNNNYQNLEDVPFRQFHANGFLGEQIVIINHQNCPLSYIEKLKLHWKAWITSKSLNLGENWHRVTFPPDYA